MSTQPPIKPHHLTHLLAHLSAFAAAYGRAPTEAALLDYFGEYAADAARTDGEDGLYARICSDLRLTPVQPCVLFHQ